MANRRAWGEGTLYYSDARDLWIWQCRCTISGTKKRISITATKRKGLLKKIDEFKLKYNQGHFDNKEITLEEWIQKWLEVFVKPNVKIKTYDNYKQRLQYVVEKFGSVNIKNITAIELQEFFNDLTVNGGKNKQGLAPESVRRIRQYLKIALESAIKNNALTKNPVEGTRPPKKRKTKPIVMNELQTAEFLKTVKKGQYIYHGISNHRFLNNNLGTEYYIKEFYNLVNLALASGMRIGELRGLSWGNVDFKKKSIRVKTQIIDTTEKDCVFDDPKTEKSIRTISIDCETLKELEDFKEYQNQYAQELGDQYDNQYDLCFTNTFGKPFSVSNFRRRYFIKMTAAAGIKEEFTIHCMRHTHATLLLKNGVNAKVVSERLGHSSVIVTLNIYAHVLEEMEMEAPSTWGNIINKAD